MCFLVTASLQRPGQSSRWGMVPGGCLLIGPASLGGGAEGSGSCWPQEESCWEHPSPGTPQSVSLSKGSPGGLDEADAPSCPLWSGRRLLQQGALCADTLTSSSLVAARQSCQVWVGRAQQGPEGTTPDLAPAERPPSQASTGLGHIGSAAWCPEGTGLGRPLPPAEPVPGPCLPDMAPAHPAASSPSPLPGHVPTLQPSLPALTGQWQQAPRTPRPLPMAPPAFLKGAECRAELGPLATAPVLCGPSCSEPPPHRCSHTT